MIKLVQFVLVRRKERHGEKDRDTYDRSEEVNDSIVATSAAARRRVT